MKITTDEKGNIVDFKLDKYDTQELLETGYVIEDEYCVAINPLNEVCVYKLFEDFTSLELYKEKGENNETV